MRRTRTPLLSKCYYLKAYRIRVPRFNAWSSVPWWAETLGAAARRCEQRVDQWRRCTRGRRCGRRRRFLLFILWKDKKKKLNFKYSWHFVIGWLWHYVPFVTFCPTNFEYFFFLAHHLKCHCLTPTRGGRVGQYFVEAGRVRTAAGGRWLKRKDYFSMI